MTDAIVLRFGELFLKKGRRNAFLRQLEENVRHALRWMPDLRIERPHARLVVGRAGGAPIDAVDRALESLGNVFGLESVSPMWRLDAVAGVDALLDAAFALASPWLTALGDGKTFRVTVNRADKSFPMSSTEIGRELGGRLASAHPGVAVDLHRPDLVVGVEIRHEVAFVYRDVAAGPGGLPVGTAGRVLLLLSGGIDSPVAGYLALKRGCVVDAVYFHSFPYTGERTRDKVVALAQRLLAYQRRMRLFVVPFTEIQKALRDGAPADQLVLLYRRAMLRIAERLAASCGALALVTGESLGQVGSQTLPNLHAIGCVARLPLLRPLVTNDKRETTVLARRIGTYAISIEPFDDCCSLFVPQHPELRGDPAHLEALEGAVDLAPLLDRAVTQTEVLALEGPP